MLALLLECNVGYYLCASASVFGRMPPHCAPVQLKKRKENCTIYTKAYTDDVKKWQLSEAPGVSDAMHPVLKFLWDEAVSG
jgi:hypothetical protein